jgi:hypothetical protein
MEGRKEMNDINNIEIWSSERRVREEVRGHVPLGWGAAFFFGEWSCEFVSLVVFLFVEFLRNGKKGIVLR